MTESAPLTFLCITTYEKGQEFMRECKRQGCRVFLLTAEKLRDAGWPRESLDDVFYIPAELPIPEIVKAVTYLARDKKIDRIVALDEFDMETAATLREHMRIPGMGLTTMRYFRDKLAMRMQALEHGIRVPDFIPVLNHDDIRYYLDHVSGPWVLKPRSEASAIGIKLIDAPDALWPILDSLGDQQSSFLLEKFIPGDVYHVDSVVSEQEVVFSSVSRYGQPPMAVAQKGGIFTTYLLSSESDDATALRDLNRELIMRWDWCAAYRTRSSSAPPVMDTFIFWSARPGWAALTSARWWKSPPASTCGGSGRASKLPAARNLTGSLPCAATMPD